jgi:hypothetical protein
MPGAVDQHLDGGAVSGSVDPPSPARHCFVDGEQSLLVEWRHGSAGWEGRVISMTWVDGAGWATVDRWLPAPSISR